MSRKPNEALLLKYLGASPVMRIIDFFLDNPLSDYSKNEIVKNLGMGRVTFFKYWNSKNRAPSRSQGQLGEPQCISSLGRTRSSSS